MFGRVRNTSLHILAFRLKYFLVEGAFNDYNTAKLKNKRMNKGCMAIIYIYIYITCLFRACCFGINKAFFLYSATQWSRLICLRITCDDRAALWDKLYIWFVKLYSQDRHRLDLLYTVVFCPNLMKLTYMFMRI